MILQLAFTSRFLLLAAMAAMVPVRSQKDWLIREEFAWAIGTLTSDSLEQRLLVRIAAYESGFRPDVADCKVTGDHGASLGAWQVQPRTEQERQDSCSGLLAQ